MEKFVVSARKYRPKGFDEVVGQSHITTTLKNAIDNNQLAQALLFCGPRGVGKTTCARILARMINDFDESHDGNALNIFELDAASNNSVDDIRNLIDQVRYPPQYGKYKVYIIDEVHMLSTQAFNAFLKTLEEPPPYAIFILATTEKHKIIPTILSRCQIFDFNRIQVNDIADHLKQIADREKIAYEEEALHLISQKADGALRDALSIFDLIVTFSSDRNITYHSTISNLHILDYEYYFKMVDHLIAEDLSATLLTFDEILKQGFDGHLFIVGLSEHLRNLMVSKDNATIQLMEVPDAAKTKYAEQANKASLSFLLSALNIANKCDLSYKGAKNQRLHVELTLMKLAHLNNVLNLASSGAEEVKKKSLATPEQAAQKETAESKPKGAPTSKVIEQNNPINIEEQQTGSLPQHVVPKPEVKISSQKLKSTTKIPKLNSILEEVKAEEEEKQANTVDEDEIYGEAPFNENALIKCWEEFAEKTKSEGRDSEYAVLKQSIRLEDKHTIVITFTNSVKMVILDRFRSDLITYLKSSLNNRHIKLETELKEDEQSKVPYTNKEKFDFMAEKKPILNELRNRLGLDTDF